MRVAPEVDAVSRADLTSRHQFQSNAQTCYNNYFCRGTASSAIKYISPGSYVALVLHVFDASSIDGIQGIVKRVTYPHGQPPEFSTTNIIQGQPD